MNPQPRSRPALLGLDPASVGLYRHVLRSPAAGLAQHARDLGATTSQTAAMFRSLERLGLARLADDGTVRVDDPRSTVGSLLEGEEAELDRQRRRLLELRSTLETLEHDYRRGLQLSGPQVPMWEPVARGDAAATVDHLIRRSTGALMQVSGHIDTGPGHEESVQERLAEGHAAGRPVRSIFPQTVLESPHWAAFAEARAAEGEVQRYLPTASITVEFGVFGRSGVLLAQGESEEDYLLIRERSLVEVFGALFEELWRGAQPALGRDSAVRDVRLLELLGLGFKDESIARQLGLSLRTVRRRISTLMDEHGVETRYQLGLAVGRSSPAAESRR